MTRIKALAAILLIAVVAACGGGAAGSASGAPPPSAAGDLPPGTAAPAGNGKVDCAAIRTAAQQLLAVQLLAQLKTPEGIAPIKAKQIGDLDLDTFLAAMKVLHALDSYASPLGDPKAAIDFYEKAGAAAKVLFATDPITQDAIDAYNVNVGTVADFLGVRRRSRERWAPPAADLVPGADRPPIATPGPVPRGPRTCCRRDP